MEEKEVILRFQRMRKKWLIFTVINAIVLIGMFYLVDSLQGNARTYAVFGMVASFFPWVIYSVTYYYCPKCGVTPMGRGGITLNPDECFSCGVKLRD